MKKILVPVDGSAASKEAVAKAFELARKYRSEVVIFNVFLEPDIAIYNKFGVIYDPNIEIVRESIKNKESRMLDSIINDLNSTGISFKKKIVPGTAYEQILCEAKEGEYDLIVMGQRGFSKIKRFFIGSQTVRVLSGATCPVLVVHKPDA